MFKFGGFRRLVPCVLAAALIAPLGAFAADETGWTDKAELGVVGTSGNTETFAFSFANELKKTMDDSSFAIKLGGLRAQRKADAGTYAFGAPAAFQLVELDDTETTAEQYYLNGRYDRNISEHFFWFTGLGWDRNRFAGIENRYQAIGGVGNTWIDTDDVTWKTDYAVTYTDQEDVNPTPTVDDTFLGARFSWEYDNKLTESTTYENDLVVDLNVDESDDWRASMLNAVSVAINDNLALKVSLLARYDNQPAFELVPLYDTVTQDTLLGTAPVELEELDTIFTASLVVNF